MPELHISKANKGTMLRPAMHVYAFTHAAHTGSQHMGKSTPGAFTTHTGAHVPKMFSLCHLKIYSWLCERYPNRHTTGMCIPSTLHTAE